MLLQLNRLLANYNQYNTISMKFGYNRNSSRKITFANYDKLQKDNNYLVCFSAIDIGIFILVRVFWHQTFKFI